MLSRAFFTSAYCFLSIVSLFTGQALMLCLILTVMNCKSAKSGRSGNYCRYLHHICFSRALDVYQFTHTALCWWRLFLFVFVFDTLNLGQLLFKKQNRTALFPAKVSLKGGFSALDWKIETKRWWASQFLSVGVNRDPFFSSLIHLTGKLI